MLDSHVTDVAILAQRCADAAGRGDRDAYAVARTQLDAALLLFDVDAAEALESPPKSRELAFVSPGRAHPHYDPERVPD